MNVQPLILVVDDDREIRSLLSEYLAANGFRTAEAADGAAMWKALDAARIDLIVLDLMMPGESAWNLFENCRENPNLPVSILPSPGRPAVVWSALKLGRDISSAKPWSRQYW